MSGHASLVLYHYEVVWVRKDLRSGPSPDVLGIQSCTPLVNTGEVGKSLIKATKLTWEWRLHHPQKRGR